MSRGPNKKAFSVDAQRGEGSAEREAALRGVPIVMDEPSVSIPQTTQTTTPAPQQNILQTLAANGGAFAPSGDKRGFQEALATPENYQQVDPGQASTVNMILAAINDVLGGSEEASSMIG